MTSSTRTESPQTIVRKLRTFLDEQMAEAALIPPICGRIRATRDDLKDRYGNEYSQEKVAARTGVSLKAYRAYETFREPNYERRQAIARALNLDPDYFESGASLARVEEQYASLLDGLERVEDRLRSLEEERQEHPDAPQSEGASD